MNKQQFRSARLQLGLSQNALSEILGIRRGTVIALETGVAPVAPGIRYATDFRLTHIHSFCMAWMLLNGGPLVPWDHKEDRERLIAFKNFHGMTKDELAALFDVSVRTLEYALSPTARRPLGMMRMMALCWMRIFGSRDPFAFPLHEGHTRESAATCPLRLDPAPTIEGRVVSDDAAPA